MAATMEAARGRWTRARMELDRAEALIGRPALVQRAWLAAQPMLAVPSADRAAIEAALEAWDPARDPVQADPLLAFHEPLYSQLRTYLLGLLAARRGDGARVRRQAAELDRLPEAPDRQEIGRDLALDLEARAAALSGRTGEALAILDSIRMPRRYDFVIRSPFYQMTLTRFLEAELLREAGRSEEALRAWTAVPELYFDAIVFQGPSELRRAEILESLGREDEAAVAYGRFLRVWRDADPALRPAVARAEQRRAALLAGR
jgi:tetratricopeptide (TPR) repeat protein